MKNNIVAELSVQLNLLTVQLHRETMIINH
jgi:hypothetical protein